jgi:hypothetical protein
VEKYGPYFVDCEEVQRIDELNLCFQKLLPGQGTPNLPSPPEGMKNLPDSLCAQRDFELQHSALNPFHTPEQGVVFHGQDQVLDICLDRLTASFGRSVLKCPKPLHQGSLPVEQSFRLDQRQPLFDVGCPVQDNDEQLVAYAEMNPLLPNPPQQDFASLLVQRVFRENSPF